MPRPDQSIYLAHFTKNGKEYDSNNPDDISDIAKMSALNRLVNILQEKKIIAADLPWTKRKAVCFTECPWCSLVQHANIYSPYGIGFTKKLIYSRNGNPVIYANPTIFNQQNWHENVYPFVTPFVPFYASGSVKNQHPFNGRAIDYTHEREWRVAKDFPFQYRYISFVVLDNLSDIKKIPQKIIDEIGTEKFIFMDTYRKIEELWPTHIMK